MGSSPRRLNIGLFEGPDTLIDVKREGELFVQDQHPHQPTPSQFAQHLIEKFHLTPLKRAWVSVSDRMVVFEPNDIQVAVIDPENDPQ